jgi:hypothetical protein
MTLRCHCTNKKPRIAGLCSLFVRIVFRILGRGARDRVLFLGPGAQVDLLAALGAEGTEFVLPGSIRPSCRRWGRHRLWHGMVKTQKLHRVSTNGHVVFQRLRFQVAALGREAYPQHVFVGRNLGNRAGVSSSVSAASGTSCLATSAGNCRRSAIILTGEPESRSRRSTRDGVEQRRQRREPGRCRRSAAAAGAAARRSRTAGRIRRRRRE